MMDDEYVVEEQSDYDYDSSSSDDEIQTLIKKECGIIEVEDDFEDEVDRVMTAHLGKVTKSDDPVPSTSANHENKTEDASKEKLTNDELLYDPDMDDEDEKWMNEQRRSYIFPTIDSSNNKKLKPLPNSDAVLNCPACLSILCMDCQRHSVYNNQYRAMFVSNCKIVDDETLKYPIKKKNKKTENKYSTDDVYNPVKCSVCNTEVAVYDSEEVYHFFNVLASY